METIFFRINEEKKSNGIGRMDFVSHIKNDDRNKRVGGKYYKPHLMQDIYLPPTLTLCKEIVVCV